MIKIAPSILAADFSKLGVELDKIKEAGADYIHFDVMDGQFVPNISFGVPIMKSISKVTDLPFDVHLMIENPDNLIPDFAQVGAEFITVHAESMYHIHRTIQLIKSFGIKAGVSINPGTSLSVIEEILSEVDLVLLMSVNPGFGGQKFIEATLDKIERLDRIRSEKGYTFEIEVDGGVTPDNALALTTRGVDILVAGSAIFNQDNYKDVIDALRRK